jgi:hypothetical protein
LAVEVAGVLGVGAADELRPAVAATVGLDWPAAAVGLGWPAGGPDWATAVVGLALAAVAVGLN